eukprot:578113-Pleurochrysis_carterae.AAC.2
MPAHARARTHARPQTHALARNRLDALAHTRRVRHASKTHTAKKSQLWARDFCVARQLRSACALKCCHGEEPALFQRRLTCAGQEALAFLRQKFSTASHGTTFEGARSAELRLCCTAVAA